MKFLTKYIFIETLKTSLGSLLFFVFILLSGNTVRDILDLVAAGKLSLLPAFYLMLALLPAIISYAMPLGLLSGIFMVIGRMASSGEITALKSTGLGIVKIAKPIWFIAMLCSLIALVVNFYYGPHSIEIYKHGLHNAVKTNPMKFITPGTFIDDFPGYLIYCEEMYHGKFYNFHIWEMNDHRKITSYGRARSGILSYDENSDSLILALENGNVEKRPALAPEAFYEKCMPMISYDKLFVHLSLDEIFGHGNGQSEKISHMDLSKLLSAKKQADLADDKDRSFSISMQLQKNLAMACGVFILASLAMALAFMVKRSDNFFHFTLTLGLGIGYYFFMSLLSSVHYFSHGYLLVWMPNLMLLPVVCWSWRMVLKQ
ncbi:MAG: LptF/LptG family permease [Puniceicoccales bacterium]|jgi:lipopolysaccharide export system permease protein|nr:LptF/LptG family permease [Puniceicoccales bacterium]